MQKKNQKDFVVHRGEKWEHHLNYIETLVHLLKAYLGTGLFAMGDAMKNGGIILGPISVVAIGILTTYCVHLLLNAAFKMSKKLYDELEIEKKEEYDIRLDYASTVEECFLHSPYKCINDMSTGMKRFLNITLCFTQYGFCTVYLIFVATNCKLVFEALVHYNGSQRTYLILVTLPILIICLVRSFKFLTPVSAFSNVCLLVVIISVVVIMCISPFPDIGERTKVGAYNTYPLFFGTVLFAYEGIGCVLPLCNDMRAPQTFGSKYGVMNIGTVINTALLVIFGFLSYWKYGEEILGSVTLNLEKGEWYSVAMQGLVGLTIALSYPIQFQVPTVIILPKIVQTCHCMHPVVAEYVFRIIAVLFTMILALIVPFLKYFISFVGAIGSTTICICIPTILEMVIADKITPWMIIKNLVINIVAIVGFITGITLCTLEVIRAFKTEPLEIFGVKLLN